MNLYFLRHGIAVKRGDTDYKDDSKRPLTKKGIREMRKITKAIRALGIRFDVILASPYDRAYETAAIVAKGLGAKKKLKVELSLASGSRPETLMRKLKNLSGRNQAVLLVGHEPFLSHLISVLISGGPDCGLVLRKGGLCRLFVPSGLRFGRCALLEWLTEPRHLVRIKK